MMLPAPIYKCGLQAHLLRLATPTLVQEKRPLPCGGVGRNGDELGTDNGSAECRA